MFIGEIDFQQEATTDVENFHMYEIERYVCKLIS